jgi:hypothetical protein
MKRTSALVLGLSLSLASMGAFAAAPKAAKSAPAAQQKAAAKTSKKAAKAPHSADSKSTTPPAEGSGSN